MWDGQMNIQEDVHHMSFHIILVFIDAFGRCEKKGINKMIWEWGRKISWNDKQELKNELEKMEISLNKK